MNQSRPFRLITAFIMLFSMLFMQYAVASYACPGLSMGQPGASIAMFTNDGNQTGMSGCQGMDAQQPSMCHAHDQVGHQSLDKPELPHVQPFTVATLTLVLPNIEVAYRSIAAQSNSPHLTRTTAPPLSIRNCCFRI